MSPPLSSTPLIDLAVAFWGAKTLLSAVELGLFPVRYSPRAPWTVTPWPPASNSIRVPPGTSSMPLSLSVCWRARARAIQHTGDQCLSRAWQAGIRRRLS